MMSDRIIGQVRDMGKQEHRQATARPQGITNTCVDDNEPGARPLGTGTTAAQPASQPRTHLFAATTTPSTSSRAPTGAVRSHGDTLR